MKAIERPLWWRVGWLAIAAVVLPALLSGSGVLPGGHGGMGAVWADDDGGGDDGGDDGDDGDDGDGDDAAAPGRDGVGRDPTPRTLSQPVVRFRVIPGQVTRTTPPRAREVTRSQSRTSRPSAPAAAPVPRADYAPREIVVTDIDAVDLARLQAEGFTVIDRVDLTALDLVMHRLALPPDLTEDQARTRVQATPTGGTADFNHFYRTDQAGSGPATVAVPTAPATETPDGLLSPPVAHNAGPGMGPEMGPLPVALTPDQPCQHLNCAALALIGWPTSRGTGCRVDVPVGIIDTGVNARHDSLAGAAIAVISLPDSLSPGNPAQDDGLNPSRPVHGTAVAAQLVSQSDARAPGLIPEARLVAVDVFRRDLGDERASVLALLQALDVLVSRKVRVINMSLSGPPNLLLQAALERLSGPGGAVVLAAAGNDGPGAPVSFPAGYPTVIAVTAVDRRGQIYRRAGRGPHLDVAAPGVDIWTAASVSGFKPKTGTSFAVPFATAVAAVLASRDPTASPDQIAARLRLLVRDAGAPGPDPIYGAGLLMLDRLCR